MTVRLTLSLSHQPATEAVPDFTGQPAGAEDPIFRSHSDRERDVLVKVTEGLGNTEIADALFIGEKTVKNHITRIFEKLGVRTRNQAIVAARDHGFVAEAAR